MSDDYDKNTSSYEDIMKAQIENARIRAKARDVEERRQSVSQSLADSLSVSLTMESMSKNSTSEVIKRENDLPPTLSMTTEPNNAGSLFSKRSKLNVQPSNPNIASQPVATNNVRSNPVNAAQTVQTTTSTKKTTNRKILTPGRLLLLGTVILASLFISSLFVWNASRQNANATPIPKGFGAVGVYIDGDVPSVDFKYLKTQNIDFVYLCSTTGDDSIDSDYISRFKAAKKAGFAEGPVIIFDASSTAYNQYLNFLNSVGSYVGDLPIAIQVNSDDVNDDDMQDTLKQLIIYLAGDYPQGVIVRVNSAGVEKLKDAFETTNFWLLANDTSDQDSRNDFIQFSESQTIGSDVKTVHLPTSVFNGSQSKWKKFLKGQNE